MSIPKFMSPDAVAENKACQAVVMELRAFFQMHGAPPVAMELCKQIEDRIEIRRLLASPAPAGEGREGVR